jgi:protein-L-isoaspartate(D-aspartate) O-methyltransferase
MPESENRTRLGHDQPPAIDRCLATPPASGRRWTLAVPPIALTLLGLSFAAWHACAEEPAPPAQTATQPAPATTTQAALPAHEHVRRRSDGRLEWPRPRTLDRQAERDRMVTTQIAQRGWGTDGVRDRRVLDAMRHVPRHAFVPGHRRSAAYSDSPLPIGWGQTISQPYIVGLMTELLDVQPGKKVLEIGTGSGYQAAVLSELTPYVFTIEILEPLAHRAAKCLDAQGYKTVACRRSDGYDGWPEHAPYDGIIVTCAAGHVPPPLWDQLKPGGRMVIPVGGIYQTQRLLVLTKQPDGSRRSRNVLPVRFVPMTGKMLEQ